MFNIQHPAEGATPWQDHIGDGDEGNSGFWWDREGVRYVLLLGTWPFNITAMDMKANLDFWPCRMGPSKAHRGYLRYAALAWAYLKDELIKKDQPIVLVGHSLGGAVAQLLGLLLAWQGYDVRNVVTYGCPTNLMRPRLRREFRSLFPNAINIAVGLDLTRFMWILILPLFLGPGTKTKVVPSKGLNPIECHLPWKIVDLIPPPWDVTKP